MSEKTEKTEESEESENSFGDVLREFRLKRGVSQNSLASKMGRPRSVIFGWEKDLGRIPDRKAVLFIASTLYLTQHEANILLRSAGHAPLTIAERLKYAPVDLSPGLLEKPEFRLNIPSATYLDLFRDQTNLREDTIRELRTQIDDLQSAVEAIAQASQQTNSASSQASIVEEELQYLRDALAQLQATSEGITAPVKFPPPEELTVTLVATTSLERLEEYRGDESIWFAIFGVSAGGFLSVLVNLVRNVSIVSGHQNR